MNDSTTGMMILEASPLPQDIISLGVEDIVKIWREHKVRGRDASKDRAQILVEAAHNSVGKRGRKRLRRILYRVILPLIRSNNEFREIYDYYRNRNKNPLKGHQAMIALCCKLIRVIYSIGQDPAREHKRHPTIDRQNEGI